MIASRAMTSLGGERGDHFEGSAADGELNAEIRFRRQLQLLAVGSAHRGAVVLEARQLAIDGTGAKTAVRVDVEVAVQLDGEARLENARSPTCRRRHLLALEIDEQVVRHRDLRQSVTSKSHRRPAAPRAHGSLACTFDS
jgi:hypothetical protein